MDTQTPPTGISSILYLSLDPHDNLTIGKYYFDCHMEDGAVFPTEVVVCK